MLSACVSVPNSIESVEQGVGFIQVAQQPNAYVGQEIRWGGIVARVENLEQDTLVEIVNLPLDYQARPMANQQTGGRFIARVPGFLDPIIYQQGKEITVVGQLTEPMPGKVGQHEIIFPVVDTRGHHLWQQRKTYQHIEVYSSWDPFWFYHRPYHWPYHYRYRVYRHHGYNDHQPYRQQHSQPLSRDVNNTPMEIDQNSQRDPTTYREHREPERFENNPPASTQRRVEQRAPTPRVETRGETERSIRQTRESQQGASRK